MDFGLDDEAILAQYPVDFVSFSYYNTMVDSIDAEQREKEDKAIIIEGQSI